MFKSDKSVFWQAFIVTLSIFLIGIFAGVILENWRTNKIDLLARKAELDLLDAKILNEIFSKENFNCEIAIEKNLEFADRIYNEAKILDRYENARELTDKLIWEHKKYDTLRIMLWLNSIKIQEKCNMTYNEIVYIYRYNEKDVDITSIQNVFSRKLGEIKKEKGKKILLIPFAGNNNISSGEVLMNKYNITKNELPIILINRKIKISSVEDLDLIENYLIS